VDSSALGLGLRCSGQPHSGDRRVRLSKIYDYLPENILQLKLSELRAGKLVTAVDKKFGGLFGTDFVPRWDTKSANKNQLRVVGSRFSVLRLVLKRGRWDSVLS
jgi:hypothetical protein